MVVSDLFVPGMYFWDVPVVREVFSDDDAKRILNIVIPPTGVPDSITWHYDRSGSYIVRSAYRLGLSLVTSPTADRPDGWARLWSLQIPSKVKMCVWRICKGFMPNRVELRRRHLLVETR